VGITPHSKINMLYIATNF